MPCLLWTLCLFAQAKPVSGKLKSYWNAPTFIAKLNTLRMTAAFIKAQGTLVRPHGSQVTKGFCLCAAECRKGASCRLWMRLRGAPCTSQGAYMVVWSDFQQGSSVPAPSNTPWCLTRDSSSISFHAHKSTSLLRDPKQILGTYLVKTNM